VRPSDVAAVRLYHLAMSPRAILQIAATPGGPAPTVTDWMEALGALTTAVFAIVAIAVSLRLARDERRRGRRQLEAEQQRHEWQLGQERERLADQVRRQFHLQTLQRVVDAYTELGAVPDSPAGHPAYGRLQVDLRALPDDVASLLRLQYGIADGLAAHRKRTGIAQARSAEPIRPVPADWIFAELADDALRLLGDAVPGTDRP